MKSDALASLFSETQASVPSTRQWWLNGARLMGIWVALMFVCAHLALVLADARPLSCKAHAHTTSTQENFRTRGEKSCFKWMPTFFTKCGPQCTGSPSNGTNPGSVS